MKPTVAELADALLAVFEGPARLTAFRDGGGVWTIGRGHTKGVVEGMRITAEQSGEYFAADVAPLLGLVADLTPIAAAAYVSFGYNCGMGALEKVLHGLDTVSNPIHTTDRRGAIEPGLVSRRRLEALLIASA